MVAFAIHQHESATRVRVSPPSWTHLPPHPIPLIVPETGFECPALCIELALVICLPEVLWLLLISCELKLELLYRTITHVQYV